MSSTSGVATTEASSLSQGGSAGGEPEETRTAVTSLPTAAVLCLAIGAYVTLLVVALLVRRYLKTKELGCDLNGDCDCCCCSSIRPSICSCSSCCSCTKLQDCFQRMFSSCSPCKNNKSCCDSSSFRDVCCVGKPAFDCGRCDCTCSCRLPECSSINCCCFEIRIKP